MEGGIASLQHRKFHRSWMCKVHKSTAVLKRKKLVLEFYFRKASGSIINNYISHIQIACLINIQQRTHPMQTLGKKYVSLHYVPTLFHSAIIFQISWTVELLDKLHLDIWLDGKYPFSCYIILWNGTKHHPIHPTPRMACMATIWNS